MTNRKLDTFEKVVDYFASRDIDIDITYDEALDAAIIDEVTTFTESDFKALVNRLREGGR